MFFEKKMCWRQNGPNVSKCAQIGPNWPKNWIFLSFLKFTTLDFADFAYSSLFPLCLTAGLTKRPEKKILRPKIWA